MPRLRGAGVAVLGFVLLASSPAIAGPIETARTAIDASDYFGARSALDQALQAGRNAPADLVEIYRLSGIVAAALGDPKAAQELFQKCLALAPQTTLAAGTSPKIGKPFAAAQEQLKDKPPLEVKTSTTSEPPTVTVEVVSDPLAMIVKVEALVVVDGTPEQTVAQEVPSGTTSIKLELPKGKRLDVRVNALDDKSNHLFEVGSKDVPIVIVGKGTEVVVKPPPAPPKPAAPVRERPLYLKWWLWAGASVVFLGAGSYFAIDTVRATNRLDELGAESGNHPFDTVQAVEDRARRSALFTNIGLITGGVLAVTTGVLYLTRPRQPAERRTAVTPTASTHGVGVAIGGTF